MPADKPDLIVDPGDLPATARELRDLLAASGRFFDRGVPLKVVPAANGGAPTTVRLTPNRIVIEAHDLCRPIKPQGDALKPVTLPGPVARLYLEMAGEWDLPPLAGITTAPVRGRIIGLKGAVRDRPPSNSAPGRICRARGSGTNVRHMCDPCNGANPLGTLNCVDVS